MAWRRPRRTTVDPCTWQARCSSSVVTNETHNTDSCFEGNTEFDRERKWCGHCREYVRFLMSVNHSFCIECGGRVRLFNPADSRSFQDHVQRHKWQAS